MRCIFRKQGEAPFDTSRFPERKTACIVSGFSVRSGKSQPFGGRCVIFCFVRSKKIPRPPWPVRFLCSANGLARPLLPACTKCFLSAIDRLLETGRHSIVQARFFDKNTYDNSHPFGKIAENHFHCGKTGAFAEVSSSI